MNIGAYYGKFTKCFDYVCWIATLTAICYWIFKYSLNEDLCVIDDKKYYENPSDMFPVLSICLKNPFTNVQLQKKNQDFNGTEYLEFLQGEVFSTRLIEIDYNNIRLNISDYVDSYVLEWRNGTAKEYKNAIQIPYQTIQIFHQTFAGFWNPAGYPAFYNCYGLQMPHDVEMTQFSVLFRNSIYPSSVRENYALLTLLHYPKQLFMSYRTIRYWTSRTSANSSYVMRFFVRGAEILQRRNKNLRSCDENWNDYDHNVLQEHLNKVGCRPPYVGNDVAELPICSNKEQMASAMLLLKSDDYGSRPPCRSMERIHYTFNEETMESTVWMNPGTFWINFSIFNPHFKEILQTR